MRPVYARYTSGMPSFADDPFASCPDRHGTGSEKWDRYAGRDVLPMWVADMDFPAPAEVLAALHDRVDHGVFGYTHEPPGFRAALAAHLDRRHGWQVDPERIVATPGVVTGLAITARLLTEHGEEILTFTPVYPPFLSLPGLAERRCVRVPLVQEAARWAIDWDALDAALTPRSKLLWLCHPHNPTGTVFRRADLVRIADVAVRHGITVVSDEIWSDLLLDEDHGGERHVPFASLDHPAARTAVTLVAPSKTWNLAGLGCAAAILPEPEMRRRWRIAGAGLVPMVNPLGYAAAIAAWTHGETWRRRLVDVLRRHRSLVQETVAATPGLACVPAEATYLAWIDCRATGSADPQAACEAAGLGPSDGREFGAPGFVRLNTGCPTPRLEEALRRLRRAFGMLACVAATLLPGTLPAAGSAGVTAAERPNVLFIAVDDLKPAVGCYGDPRAKTPAIDRLADRGTVFERAYCMQAVCSPSRNAVLTGLRPETLRIYDLATNFRRRVPTVKTLPEWFREHGHASHGIGKIFHVGHGNHEDPVSWSVPHVQERSIEYALAATGAKATREEARFANAPGDPRSLEKGAALERADVPDEAYADGRIATLAIERLRGFRRTGERFFLAVGFLKPHLPFCAPARYWDLHDPATLPLAATRVPPGGAPPFAPQFGGELRNYEGIPERGALPEAMQRELVHGYYAAASFMDAQLGRLLDELDALGLAEDTIVILWGDHGWHLGDHGMWCKHTNYEQATRAPLIVAAPGRRGGRRTAAIVEFIDIYPTLCELAGLARPPHLEGESLVPLLDDPDRPTSKPAFQVYPRRDKHLGPLLGHAVRSDHWRYVEWRRADGVVAARELYDLEGDPNETVNVADDAARGPVVAEHAALLAARLAVPPPPGLDLRDPAAP
jgi:iduronate 2-sulfatase